MNTSGQKSLDAIGEIADFENLYRKYYVYLCLIAEHIVRNHSDAEEIVSDVFIKLWNNRGKIIINISVRAYLVKAVHNTALNFIEQNKIVTGLTDSLSISDIGILAWEDYPLERLYENEIMDILDHGIRSLPASCREIFLLSRNENLKYHEIADRLGISVNTVKTQIKIALASLRFRLKDYLTILFLCLFNKM